MQQQFTGPIPPYQFQQTSYSMMLLQQTTINRTPTRSNIKYNTQNEPETTKNYTWQQVKKRKISNQTPETKTVGNPVLFNAQNRYEELSRFSDEEMQTKETDEAATTLNTNNQENLNPHQYMYIWGNKLP
jgi:CRISPR/Cas system-associated protein Cas5 (RAMP superfamily)